MNQSESTPASHRVTILGMPCLMYSSALVTAMLDVFSILHTRVRCIPDQTRKGKLLTEGVTRHQQMRSTAVASEWIFFEWQTHVVDAQ